MILVLEGRRREATRSTEKLLSQKQHTIDFLKKVQRHTQKLHKQDCKDYKESLSLPAKDAKTSTDDETCGNSLPFWKQPEFIVDKLCIEIIITREKKLNRL